MDNKEFHIKIGKKLKFIRKHHSLSQTELAYIMEVSPQQIQKYEAGKNRIAIDRLIELCKLVGISIDDFIYKPSAELFKKTSKLN